MDLQEVRLFKEFTKKTSCCPKSAHRDNHRTTLPQLPDEHYEVVRWVQTLGTSCVGLTPSHLTGIVLSSVDSSDVYSRLAHLVPV
jgi:hypothetical protein